MPEELPETLRPPPLANVLVWAPTLVMLSDLDPDARRAIAVETAERLAGLGAAETFPGRNAAYRDTVAYGETEELRDFMAPHTVVTGPHAWDRSSCGMVVRRLWAALGSDGVSLQPPYRTGTVMSALESLARACGTWRTPTLGGLLPYSGDAVFLGGGQHVFTVTACHDGVLDSVDGGQEGGNNGGTEIAVKSRALVVRGGSMFVRSLKTGAERPVRGWADVTALPFVREARDAVRLDG